MPDLADQNARVLDQFRQQADAYAALVNTAPLNTGGAAKDPLIEALAPAPTDRVLDVGCGSGQFAVAIAPHVAQVAGVDLTPEMLAKARDQQAKAGVANIDWRQADSTALPVADGTFDIVTSRSMLHHAADPAATLAEMRRACVPGGRIAVLDLTPAPDKAPAFDAVELLRDPSHARALTVAELRALGAGLGLQELEVRPRATDLPLEMTLATSFPPPGVLERVRALYARDAAGGADCFGLKARVQDGQIWVTYPMTLVLWRR
ncbi:methyltransferase domain-containing protein [Phenylobacterium sp. LjRoot225]|uniref:class I SAM-dependent methyltransferase n=1 Tax=Phenylobacterium sp. LjRoot225 TaxID=3342285 RepID=UPI003ED16569